MDICDNLHKHQHRNLQVAKYIYIVPYYLKNSKNNDSLETALCQKMTWLGHSDLIVLIF